jgi:hypothetical protein
MSSRNHTPRSVVPDVSGRPPDALAPAVTSELEQGLGRLHEQTYPDLGFLLVNVPAGPLVDRAALVRHTAGRV